MVRRLSPEDFYKIRDPKHFHAAMRADVELLLSKRAYLSLTTVIMCCLDALAAGSGAPGKGKFEGFVTKHFPGLCTDLESASPGRRNGSKILYEEFRNGFAHLRGPKSKFAIAEDHELGGDWADRVEIDAVGQFVAINIDRLAKEFLRVLGQL
jgi:hypothetical protein